jgi:ankyrin repeat protein
METKNEEIILMLIEKSTTIDEKSLSIATRKGNLNVVKYLSEKKEFDVQEGLLDALYYKQDEILDYLIASGAKPSTELLRNAISVNYIYGIKKLINEGVDVNHIYDTNETPLLLSIQEIDAIDLDIIDFLITQGASINATNSYGETALHLATQSGPEYIKIIELLIDNNADLKAKTLKGSTPLDYATDKEIRSLIKKRLRK